MKKHIYFVVFLMAFLAGTTAPVWGQASTEGKEFWVALLMANSPSGFSEGSFEPFIAISAKKQCQVTVSNPAQNWTQPVRTVQADSWLVINDIPVDKWYDPTWTANNASEIVRNLGIKVEATEEVSCYAAIRMEFSYDATNVLPTTALGSHYIIQDYPPYNSEGESHAVFVIAAAEDNTTVEITPSITTQNGKAAGTSFTVNLNKGETYQVIGKDKESFSGTVVNAYKKGDKSSPKKIAIFSGADFTQVPGGKSARDCLYEQAMPTDYWGTQFVVTRSQEKDANRVRITAQTDGTTISIDGITLSESLNAGETYEFEMSENLASTDMASAISKAGRTAPPVLTGDAHYIETSCPCAVYAYDVSSDYRFSTTAKLGDPSMVWISPLQQRISKITFGACGTTGEEGKTNRHYVNIVCLTSDANNVHLSSDQRPNIPVSFTPVPGNPEYSYARVFLVDTDSKDADKIYTLTSKNGVVAHVYGSGFNESYAYSVGSAAVKQGIKVNNQIFTDGYISPDKFCFGEELMFDAKVGTDEITRVDWNFGDGITIKNGEAQTTHQYTVPGWYDVRADIYGSQACTDEPAQYMGYVQFSFRVVRPDTTYVYADPECQAEDYTGDLKNDTIWPTDVTDCSNITVTVVPKGRITSSQDEVKAHDSYTDPQSGITYPRDPNNPQEYDQIVDVNLTELLGIKNAAGCDTIIHRHIVIITCLDMTISNDSANQHACEGESFSLPYTFRKGTIGDTYFILNGQKTAVTPENDYIALPVEDLKPGKYKASISVNDPNCEQTFDFPIDFAVYYPATIFKYKFNNVLAVYNKAHNGGYDFVGYQWYRNGEEIIGANESVYHVDSTFTVDDEYYVVLTDKNGLSLPSCPQTITVVRPMESPSAPAQKVMRNQRMYILRQEQIYDIFGRRVE